MSTRPVVGSHIDLRPNREGDLRAFVVGTRIRVQDIVSDHERHGLTPEEIVREYPHLSLAQVHAALAYYFDHRDDVRRQMKADEQYAREIEAEQESSRQRPGDMDADDDSVSP